MRDGDTPAWAPVALIGAATLVAATLWISGLADAGLVSDVELDAYDRVRAGLGDAVPEIRRAPTLPTAARTLGMERFGIELGLRLPGAMAAVALVAAAAWLALRRGASLAVAGLTASFVLAFPAVSAGARTASHGIVGECFGVLAVCAAILAGEPGPTLRRVLAGCAAAMTWAAAVASSGLVLGGAIPLSAIAAWWSSSRNDDARRVARPIRIAAWLGFGITIGVAAVLARDQGDGYIPLLGAAKELDLIDQPFRRAPSAALEELGHGVFPWAAAVVAGAAVVRGQRWALLWLVIGVVVVMPWSAIYGAQHAPVTVPSAILAAHAVAALFDPERAVLQRRALALVMVGGVWIQAKDLEKFPSRAAAPHHHFVREATFPDDAIGASERLGESARWSWMALLFGFGLATRSRDATRWPDWTQAATIERSERVSSVRRHGPAALVGAALVAQAFTVRGVFDAESEQLGARRIFATHARWVSEGLVPDALGMHRVRDPGLDLYGPPPEHRVSLATRGSVAEYLDVAQPRVVMVRATDHPALVQMSRQNQWPLTVLDWDHHDLKLVANHVPSGLRDVRPLGDILFDEATAPTLAHPTFVRFEESVEVIGWQIDGELARGNTITVSVALRAVGRLSSSSKIFVRLQQGEISKINPFSETLAGGLYPPAQWRPGDVVIHRSEIEIPWVNTLPGPHELFVGLAMSDKKNATITLPEARTGEFGVSLRGRKHREFANLALLEIR